MHVKFSLTPQNRINDVPITKIGKKRINEEKANTQADRHLKKILKPIQNIVNRVILQIFKALNYSENKCIVTIYIDKIKRA